MEREMTATGPAVASGADASAPGIIPAVQHVVVKKAIIMTIIDADAGRGILDDELIADIYEVAPRIRGISRLHGRCGDRAQKHQ
jgi:hypothetical protein